MNKKALFLTIFLSLLIGTAIAYLLKFPALPKSPPPATSPSIKTLSTPPPFVLNSTSNLPNELDKLNPPDFSPDLKNLLQDADQL